MRYVPGRPHGSPSSRLPRRPKWPLESAKIDSVFYTDLQLRWFAPSFADNFGFALGVNNLFNVKAPGCLGCETNNLAVSVHDVPGRYVYARATVKY